MKSFARQLARVGFFAFILAFWGPALGQGYPNKPVKLLIPYGPGGAVDMMGRLIGKKLQDLNGQAYVVENKGGAGGNIASAEVAHATPDGYTILFGATGQISIAPAIFGSKLGFDPSKDLIAVSLVATTPYVLVANMALPIKSVADLIAYGRSNKLSFASAGTGSADHLAGELFNKLTGLTAVHTPYRGAGQALMDVVAGNVQFEFVSPLPAMPLVESNKLRLLAVTTKSPSPAMPNVPTVAETVPGYEIMPWYGFFVPAGTPTSIVSKIASDLKTVLSSEDMQQTFLQRGLNPAPNTPQEFSSFLRSDMAKWGELARDSGIKPE